MIFLDLGTLRNAQLLQEPIKSLSAAIGLHGAVRLLHEFSDGFSETRVVLAETRLGPNDPQPFRLVFKIGAADALRDEVSRYLEFVEHARAASAFVPIREARCTLDALPNNDTLAAIAYGHAGDVFGARDCVPFKSVFREGVRGDRPLDAVAEMIESLARVMGSLYGEPTQRFAHEVAAYYLEHWAPDYQVAADSLVPTDGYPLLSLQRLNPSYFRNEPPSSGAALRKEAESPFNGNQFDIVLHRCVVNKVERERLVACVNSPADLALHIDTRELSPDSRAEIVPGSTISLWVPRNVSRCDFYLRQLRLGLQSMDEHAPTFTVGPLCLHNPLTHFSAPMLAATQPPASTFMVPGHGDLHPGNVLIAGSTPAIIDYGKSVTEIPLGVDAARFFVSLVRDVLAEELSFEDLALVLAEALGLGSFLREDDSPMSRAARLLKLVTERLVPSNAPGSHDLWPVHLYGCSWIGLKWPHGSPQAYRACFLLAGVALQCLLGPASAGAHGSACPPDRTGDGRPTQPLTVTRLIKPEGPAEILILVARFDGAADYDPTARIYSTLADLIFETLRDLGRVERVEEVISSRKDAVALAERYRASMIVWGTYDNMGVSPRYEVTRDSLVVRRSMIQLDQATRYQLSERFDPYITENLAAEISFLSLKAVAEMCLLNLNYDAAIKVFHRALSLVPDPERARKLDAADMYRSLAAAYFALKMDDEAMEANGKAREADPTDLMTEIQNLHIRARVEKRSIAQHLEELKKMLRARLAAGTDRAEEAGALRAVLEKLEPLRTPADLVKMLESELPKMQKPSSATGLKTLNTQFKKDVMVHLQRAEELAGRKKYQKSLAEIKSALRLNPRCAEAFTLRAKVLALTDRVADALKDLKKSESLYPRDYKIFSYRGQILCEALADYEGALQEFDRAVELDMPKQVIRPWWGKAMIAVGRADEAMRLVREWEVDPTDPDLFVFRSQYHRNKGDYEAALLEADQAIKLDAKDAMNFKERAAVYAAMGRREHAIQDLEHAIECAVDGTFTMHLLRERLKELRAPADAGGEETGAATGS
jgi:tetratricopeptide (TPR) repeat protein